MDSDKNRSYRFPEKPLGKESAVGPASRYIWKMIFVLALFALTVWILRLF